MENGKKKARYRWIYIPAPRSAAQYPAGVSAASCPNYPFCNLAPVVPLGYVNTAGYPAGVSAAVCPGYPYC